jgi:hypothetical protein
MPKTYNPKTGAYVVHSLNKDSKNSLYVLVQMKIMDGAVHIQARSPMYPKKNRPFGMVWDFHPPALGLKAIEEWLQFCVTGMLKEPITDSEEAEANLKENAPKCEKCGSSAVCACGECLKCKPEHTVKYKAVDMAMMGKLFKDLAIKTAAAKPSPGLEVTEESDEDEESGEPEEVDSPNVVNLCTTCKQPVCESCGTCHICENNQEDTNV